MKNFVLAILILCFETVHGQDYLQLTKLNTSCDTIILETMVRYNLGSGYQCPPLVGYPTSIHGDTLVLSLYYDKSGGWLANFCTSIDTINIPVPSSTSILLGKTYSIYNSHADTTNVVDTEALQLCSVNSNNEISFMNTNINVYPNPFHSSTTIHTTENGVFKIYNALGKLLHQERIYNTLTVIGRSELDVGMYFYRFVNDKGDVIKGKFVVD